MVRELCFFMLYCISDPNVLSWSSSSFLNIVLAQWEIAQNVTILAGSLLPGACKRHAEA